MKRFVLFAGVLLCLANVAEARGRRSSGGGSTGAGMEYVPTPFSTAKTFYGGTLSLEEIADYRARWMAETETLSHGIDGMVPQCPSWQQPGVGGEGIGCGGGTDYRNIATCIVGSEVIADGHAVSRSGTIYRVRFFR